MREAREILSEEAETEALRVYQFAFVPDPQIFIAVGKPLFHALSTGIAGNAIYDCIKKLLKGRQIPTQAEALTKTKNRLTVRNGKRRLKVTIESDIEQVVEAALSQLVDIAPEVFEPGEDSDVPEQTFVKI